MENDAKQVLTHQSGLESDNPLAQTIQQCVKALPSISPKVTDPFKQSVHMMKLATQQRLRKGIKLYTKLEYHQGTTQLTITILNKSTQIPVNLSKADLTFEPIQDTSDAKPPSISTLDQLSLFLSPSSVIQLLPNCQHHEIINITTPTPMQYDGRIQLHVSPTDVPLLDPVPLTQTFGLYLIDQMKKSVIPSSDLHLQEQQETGHEWVFQGQFLRDTFDLDPVMTLEVGMLLCLESSNVKIISRIEYISCDDDTIQVCFFGKNKDLVRSLVYELDSLDV
ncbi:hypothetical protein BC941DRAFT_502846 [Chlamydoabsidia padenii]|nr:hypothetical protein BC941DRAFT_502846 [Chlamydoabsidia padenii]